MSELHVAPRLKWARSAILICAVLVGAATCVRAIEQAGHHGGTRQKTESFDHDPGWHGVNNRAARHNQPRMVRQDFGYSSNTNHAGGTAGEMGGFVSPDGQIAFYGQAIEPCDLSQPLSASGKVCLGEGGTHVLLGFFNAQTVNEWRTPNTVVLRLNGRGDKFFAYVEYCTAKWRAGGDTTPFPSVADPKTGRMTLIGFPCNQPLKWSLAYDPQGAGGRGVVTATIGDSTAVCELEKGHRQDGAKFDHFGILNVMKSADSGSEAWFDDVTIQGGAPEDFSQNPGWEQRNNHQTGRARIVRPWFDFGFSETHFAGGRSPGELGGLTFRGDCREANRTACYGDRVGPLSLAKPLRASGKVALRRGVSDSTTLFGFYHSTASMRVNEAQNDAVPEGVLGIHIEGPSSEGFRFYPVVRMSGASGSLGSVRESPAILPDGTCHDWTLSYQPSTTAGRGRVTVTLDKQTTTLDLPPDERRNATSFDRFGIVTSWIDGNSQDVFWDDISYTSAQE